MADGAQKIVAAVGEGQHEAMASSSTRTPGSSSRASPAGRARSTPSGCMRVRHEGGRRRHARQGRRRVRRQVPVFDTVAEAVKETGANATMIFVPPPVAADAILEAADAGHRARRLHHRGHPGRRHGAGAPRARLAGQAERASIGPNCPGVITPGECKIGIMPGHIHKPGNVGVVSRSRHADLRGRLAAHARSASASRPASASAAIRSTAPTSSTC